MQNLESMSRVFYWKYTLRSAQPLNAQSSRTEHDGALIRLENGGVGCIHPWPELGDLPLSEQLKILQEGGETPLICEALKCALIDGGMRSNRGKSLFIHPIPESHWLAGKCDEPSDVKKEGFTTVKIKGSSDLVELKKRVERWTLEGFRIRIDMNESVGLRDFLRFWEELDTKTVDSIELVEDPISWNAKTWEVLRNAGVKIAIDMSNEQEWNAKDIRVIKPARDGGSFLGHRPFFVTSYMDHAIGQMWAALMASEYRDHHGKETVLTCGLMTHRCFEPDDFFERIETKGSILQAPEGTGLGFDDLLDKLPWKKLT